MITILNLKVSNLKREKQWLELLAEVPQDSAF